MKTSGGDLAARLVLDTSAYAQFRHGHGAVLDWMAAAQVVYLPTIVLGELEAGFELGSRAKENRAMLRQFLREPFVSTLAVTAEAASRYGQVFGQLRRAGTPIPTNDIWIASLVLDCGGHLLTFDQHFRHIDSLDYTLL